MEPLAAASALHFGFSNEVPSTARVECDVDLYRRRLRRVRAAVAAASAEMFTPGEPVKKACRYVKTKLTFSLSDADALRYTSVVLRICNLSRPVDWERCTRQEATLWTGRKFVERSGYTISEYTPPDREVVLEALRQTVPAELMNELETFHVAWRGFSGFPFYYTATDLLVEYVSPSAWRYMNIVVSDGTYRHLGSVMAWIGIPQEHWLPEHVRPLFRIAPGYHVDYWTLKDTAEGRVFHTEMVANWECHIRNLTTQGLSSVLNFLVPLYVDWLYVSGVDYRKVVSVLGDIMVYVLSVVSHVDETAFRDLPLPKVWPPPARLRTVRYLLDILPTRELESLLTRTDVSVPIQSILLGYVADAIESK